MASRNGDETALGGVKGRKAPAGVRAGVSSPPSFASPGAPERPTSEDFAFQDHALEGVSRTFALTIPQLPPGLREVVSNAYLLCRIADTIEDDPELEGSEKSAFHEAFLGVLERREDPVRLARDLAPRLAPSTLTAERELVRELDRVARITWSFSPRQRAALVRCVRTMCEGMDRFQRKRPPRGLRNVAELHEYCYYVAGVVGEMLSELFCAHCPEIEARREEIFARTVSFGQGLQMTNILKDVWDDLERGFCWLPRDVFERRGVDLDTLEPGQTSAAFQAGLRELVAVAHGHLRNALDYTLLIPAHERGIRRFLLWSLGLAVLTLRKLEGRIDFVRSPDVKVRRSTVRSTVFLSNALARHDRLLRIAFRLCARPLPPPVPAP